MAGCSRENAAPAAEPTSRPDAASKVTPDVVPPEPPPTQLQAQAWVEDVRMGTRLGARGAVVDQRHRFIPGERIQISMNVAEAPPDASFRIEWYGPDDERVETHISSIKPRQRHLSAAATHTSRWKPGDYRAVIYAGDELVHVERFQLAMVR